MEDVLEGIPGVKVFNGQQEYGQFIRDRRGGCSGVPLIGPHEAAFAKVTEIAGIPGTGKTTLMLQTAIRCLQMSSAWTVLYLDTSGNVTSSRLRSMMAAQFAGSFDAVLPLLERLCVIQLTSFYTFFGFVQHYAQEWIEQRRCALLVIDSVAMPFRGLDASCTLSDRINYTHRLGSLRAHLFGAGVLLSRLATFNACAVLTTNLMSTKIDEGDHHRYLSPSLGQTWRAYVSLRLNVFIYKKQYASMLFA